MEKQLTDISSKLEGISERMDALEKSQMEATTITTPSSAAPSHKQRTRITPTSLQVELLFITQLHYIIIIYNF